MIKIFLSMTLIGFIFMGCANNGVQPGFSLEGEVSTKIGRFSTIDSKNLFLKRIKNIDLRERYENCLNELKNHKKLESTCINLYRESIKKCFIYDSNISCGILRNISILYDNRDMVRKVDEKLGNNLSLFSDNEKLLDNQYPVSTIYIRASGGLRTYDFKTAEPIWSFSIGTAPIRSNVKQSSSLDSNKSFNSNLGDFIFKDANDSSIGRNIKNDHFIALTWAPESESGFIKNQKLSGEDMLAIYFGEKNLFNDYFGLYVSLSCTLSTSDESRLDNNVLKYFYNIYNIGLTYSPTSDFILLGGIGYSEERDELKYREESEVTCDSFGFCQTISNYNYKSKQTYHRKNLNAGIMYSFENNFGVMVGYDSAPKALSFGAFWLF